jgi:hypothetical protein
VNLPSLRIFFFNLFKKVPSLINDIKIPKDLMGGFIESMPAMFFGGSNSVTFLHYDIDLASYFPYPFWWTQAHYPYSITNGKIGYIAYPMQLMP